MRETRLIALTVVLTLAVATASTTEADSRGRHGKVEVVEQGQVFCPSATLVFRNVVIPRGHCSVLTVLRNTRGTFLAFVEPREEIPRNQVVLLTTPVGVKLRRRILFLVPIQPAIAVVPVNTIALVPVRVVDFGPRLSITVISQPSPNVTVIFNAQQ